MLSLRLNVNPVPASRPRVSRFGTYYGKRHQAFRSDAVALLSEMREGGFLPAVPLSGRLRVWVVFSAKKPKTTRLTAPRGDIDNFLKLLLDCCTGYIWEDDQQIDHICAHKDFAPGEGFIDLLVEENDNGETDGVVRRDKKETLPDSVDSGTPRNEGFDFCAGGHVSLPHLPPRRES